MLFLTDLTAEIKLWQEEGEEVIVLADMNEDVLAPDIQKFCAETHLVEMISFLHEASLVLTHQRGSKAIDGIFLSQSLLEEAKGGFLRFGEVMVSNHRAVWIDIPAQYFNMLHTNNITKATDR